MVDKVTIMLVGNPAIRTAVRAILETDGRLRVLAEADDGDEAIRLFRVRPAQVVVICPSTTEDDLLDTARKVELEAPDLRILALGGERTVLDGVGADSSRTRAVGMEAAKCLTGVAVELGRR